MRSGIALDGRGAVAIAADAEPVLAGDLHQVGGLPEQPRDFLVLQPGSPPSNCNGSARGNGPFTCLARRMDVLTEALLIPGILAFPFAPPRSAPTARVRHGERGQLRQRGAPDSLATIFGNDLALTTASATLDAADSFPRNWPPPRRNRGRCRASVLRITHADQPGHPWRNRPGDRGCRDALHRRRHFDGNGLHPAPRAPASLPPMPAAPAGRDSERRDLRAAPFVVQTADNGADTRTRLAVYGTGFATPRRSPRRRRTPRATVMT